ncbi:sugar transferase [Lactiplantibacillus plantarum]|uniref:Priming glycosyltransferase,undecaprenyl-phosphate beta-glucosephosphotransferase n=6 Tax=Lactiplantibacillus TaxID=2767842 RepID=F9UN26_LACPL|nr:priming glycosyltransferase [Lactiplantibacillus plantarum JDM1]ADN98216.1 priming glycosyltransferase [Lactiplantibacillus plantarum ST-III]APD00684.2 sugar transferase [Lactiplantibacillus plantarum]AUV71977.1 sugar transferase [Lactiplantibacillus plantarum subsp. plantarum]MCS6093797.1 sugar transferase [Lactobacillus sp. LMY-20]TYA05160.1 sugar transferase [Lactobacillus sp. CAB1-7]CCC78615.1 priming glycosyltransferase,undecaprenyl-phosphate beta-glucosephosphotransferase [Lactiplant
MLLMELKEREIRPITIDAGRQHRRYGYRFIKRVFDFVASLLGLIILSPLFLLIAIAIKVEDPKGAVFYSQTRLGRGEVPFKMYKFRSMVSNADELLEKLLKDNEIDGAMFKMQDDPRVTKIGRFIRKYSIDELPQLLNVLQGSMSLVGPRPPLPREVEEYSDYDKQRLAVKPGCTGLWQATVRNSVGFDEMVKLDLTYISKRSVAFDVYILFKTVVIMFKPNGAY